MINLLLASHREKRGRYLPIVPVAARVSIAILVAAGADLLFSAIYWGYRGVAPAQVLMSVASWVLGHKPSATPGALALAGAIQVALYGPAVLALALWVTKRPAAAAHWAATGSVWGIIAYLVTFQFVVPAIAHPIVPNASAPWVISCLLLHLCLIGPATGWLILRQGKN